MVMHAEGIEVVFELEEVTKFVAKSGLDTKDEISVAILPEDATSSTYLKDWP